MNIEDINKVNKSVTFNRNYYLDNYKAFLIILVVTTHFLGALADKSGIIKTYTIFTNMFYMPAFVMISGYFSKNFNLLKIIKSILVPYLFFQCLNLLVDYIILKQDFQFTLVIPEFTLWYLLSLFFWRICIHSFIKLKYPFAFALILSLLIGLDSNVGTFLSLSRTVYYFPFFILGYKCNIDKISRLRNVATQCVSLLIITVTIVVIFFTCKGYSEFYFRGSTSYSGLDQSLGEGIVFRSFCYAIAVLLTFCVAMLIPKNRNIFSYLGERTMAIYMWHGIIYRIIRYGTSVYSFLGESNFILRIIWAGCVVLLVLILGSRFIFTVTNLISKLPVERLLNKKDEIDF